MSGPRYSLSPGALSVWRFLRDQGGYWMPGDIAATLRPAGDPRSANQRVARWLSALRAQQCVAINPRAIRVKSYGVTARCWPPEGESLEPQPMEAACDGLEH